MDEKEVIRKYLALIEKFTNGDMTAPEFSTKYIDEFLDEEGGLPDETFKPLDYLFAEVDAYCEDPALRGEWEIDEDELLEAANETAVKLEQRKEEICEN